VRATTGIEPFGALVRQAMGAEPFASARRVFCVVDNGWRLLLDPDRRASRS
jgi:hypothetical protein